MFIKIVRLGDWLIDLANIYEKDFRKLASFPYLIKQAIYSMK